LLLKDKAAAFGGLGLEAGGFSLDFDGLGEFTELEFDSLDYNTLSGGEDDGVLLLSFEALGRDFQAEGTGQQLLKHEVTVGVCGGLADLIGTDVRNFYGDPCDGAPGGVN